MTAAPELLIPIEHPRLEHVTGFLYEPPAGAAARDSIVLLAHGAGAPPDSDFMVAMATGLAARGLLTMTFRYPYMELRARDGKRRGPDRAPTLEAVHAQALERFVEHAGGRGERRVLLAGKSMGGRMGTHLAAKGVDCAGLVLFGYPLHPAGKPERQRSEHFAAMVQPALFLQGTRDRLCDLDLLRPALETYGGAATLEVIEGADHGFSVLKRSGRTDAEVREQMLERVLRWEASTWPG